MALMNCPHCGRMMATGTRCVHCGYDPTQEKKSQLIPCKACGKEISSAALSCPHCGEPTEYAQKLEREKENAKREIERGKSSERSALAVTAVFGAIFIIIGLVLIFMQTSTISHDLNVWYSDYDYKGSLSNHETQVLMLLGLGIVLAVIGVIDLIRVKIKYDKLK